jgi:hypothetical protein
LIVVLPGFAAKTNPLAPSINATPVLLLLQVPPDVPVVEKRLVVLAHIEDGPIIVPGTEPALIVSVNGADIEDPQLGVLTK